jgi:hypothetical protein
MVGNGYIWWLSANKASKKWLEIFCDSKFLLEPRGNLSQ